MDDLLNYRRVDDSLVTSGLPTEDQLRSAAESGFEVVINLALDNNPPYSLAGEAEIVKHLEMDYIHIPVDFSAPSAADLERFCDAMAANTPRKKFVHCALNKRVSAFLGLYRVTRLHWDRDAAFELMHGLWEPDAVWQAFIDTTLAEHGPR